MRDPFEDLGEPSRIAFSGDWHASVTHAVSAIQHAKDHGADVVVHVGDFGYTFRPSFICTVVDELVDLDIPLLFVEGNHDDPSALSGPVAPNGLREIGQNLWHIPRSFRWRWGGMRFLGCGGAHSVDRQWRVPGVSWWPEESLTETDVQRCIDGGPTDFLISHDCPTGVVIPGIDDRTDPAPFPPLEIALAQEHRRMLRRIVDATRPTTIVHGHYHVAYEDADNELGARVVGLDMDGTPMARNMRFYDMDGGWVS